MTDTTRLGCHTKGLTVKRRERDPLGLASKIIAYFAANPDEELTVEDIQKKFDVKSMGVVYNRISEMAKKGEIDYEPRVVRAKVKR